MTFFNRHWQLQFDFGGKNLMTNLESLITVRLTQGRPMDEAELFVETNVKIHKPYGSNPIRDITLVIIIGKIRTSSILVLA